MTDRTLPFVTSNNLNSITNDLPRTLEGHLVKYHIIVPLCSNVGRRLGSAVAFVADVSIPIT